MSTIGIVCPPVPGHLHPTCALGRVLADRGHRVVQLSVEDARGRVEAAGLQLRVLGAEEFPVGAVEEQLSVLGELRGFAQLRFTLQVIERFVDTYMAELPAALEAEGVELLIVDESSVGAASVAQAMGLPYLSLSSALSFRPDPAVPAPFTTWGPARGRLDRWRNALVLWTMLRLVPVGLTPVNRGRKHLGLPPIGDPWEELSPQLHLLTLPEVMAFPRDEAVPELHHVGPLVLPTARAPVAFPWEALDGRPLVYLSMGTVQNRILDTFRRVAQAAQGLDAQLVISMGGAAPPAALGELPGAPIVVPFAPQLELLERAALFVSHGGMNSALESMSAGVPMVLLPVGNDQPGVAARVHHAGAGISLGTSQPRAGRIRGALEAVLGEPGFRRCAQALAGEIAGGPGPEGAADLAEGLLT